MSSGKILLGALAGLAAGALIGILFAPDKGTETRRKITEKGEGLAEEVKVKFNEFVESITNKFDKVKSDVTDFAQKGKAKAEKVENDMKSSMNDLKSSMAE